MGSVDGYNVLYLLWQGPKICGALVVEIYQRGKAIGGCGHVGNVRERATFPIPKGMRKRSQTAKD